MTFIILFLQSKEDEIKNILASADAYAVENRSQADVYAAMAETLNEAWRELNLKLEHRSMLLEQSIAFHQSAQDVSSLSSFIPSPTDVKFDFHYVVMIERHEYI